MDAIKFLRNKGILKNDKTQFIIKFSNGEEVDIVNLLTEYSKIKKKFRVLDRCDHGYNSIKGEKLYCCAKKIR